MHTILEINHLSKKYKDINAVDDLSFSVNSGDVYGFLGQNGAGKSTTIRMMLTLIEPTSGEINIFGKPLNKNRHEILSKIGAVIERPDLYKYLTAYENLKLFAKMSNVHVTHKLLMDQLDMVGLADRSESKVKTYSQGMKQRLGIGIALVHNPDLIVLDEPTNGLDPQGIADIRHLILKLSTEMGKTVVVSSHLLSEIELIANRMIVIHKGKKIVEGFVKDLLDPSKTLVEIETTDNEMAKSILNKSAFASMVVDNNEKLHLTINKIEISALIKFMVDANVQIIAVTPRHSLEDYFLSLTKTA
jgi:ABC-type multidrug transport system ATPase subunit